MNLRHLRPDLYRFWLLLLTQHSLERCSRAALFTYFRNPFMCRPAELILGHREGRFGGGGGEDLEEGHIEAGHVGNELLEEGHNGKAHFENGKFEDELFKEGHQDVPENHGPSSGDLRNPFRSQELEKKDFQWCVVSGAAYRLDLRVLGPACQFDPLCGGVVYAPSRPPAFVAVFLVGVSLFVSLLGVWLPRLLCYKTRNRLALRLQRACRRALLRMVLAMSLMRVLMEVQLITFFPQSISATGPITLLMCLLIGSVIISKCVSPSSKAVIHRTQILPLSVVEVF